MKIKQTIKKIEEEIENIDKWITENAQYIKDGFRKTKTFQKIIDGVIRGLKDKGWDDDLGNNAVEVFRPLLEELYLDGCVQGVYGQKKADLRITLFISKLALKDVLSEINNFETKQLSHCKNNPDGLCDECEVDYKRIKELKQKLGIK